MDKLSSKKSIIPMSIFLELALILTMRILYSLVHISENNFTCLKKNVLLVDS